MHEETDMNLEGIIERESKKIVGREKELKERERMR